jgi:class 3 adenylate cyclase/tetratricopeptide (TPR) repeat protein
VPETVTTGSTSLAQFASYLPRLLVERLAARGMPQAPSSESVPAAVLFADIAEFTPLVEKYAALGAVGVEQLSQTMNRLFGLLVEHVYAHGGDVLRFPGDAVIAVWTEADLAESTALSAQCALAIQESFAKLSPIEGSRLRVRCSVGAGPVSLLELGGFHDRWEFLAAGDALSQLREVLSLVKPGDTFLTAAAHRVLSGRISGSAAEHGSFKLASVSKPATLPVEPLLPLHALPPDSDLEPVVRGHVPDVVVQRLLAGQQGWMGELRRVVVLFLELRGCDLAKPDELDRAHAAVRVLQEAVAQYEGAINQLLVDDKGTVLVAGWGLPSCTHEDDAARAIQAAMQMQSRLSSLGLGSSIGLASGRVFCGERSDPRRREYAMVGSVVNLAARLMQAADDAILAEANVSRAARGRVLLESGGAIAVKGRLELVDVFRPVERSTNSRRALSTTTLIGRAAERLALVGALESLREEGGRKLVLVEGEAGIGKSVLLEHFFQSAESSGITVARATADPLERNTPWLVWRELLPRALGLETLTIPDRQRWIRDRLPPEKQEWAPLLNAVFPLELPVPESVRQMSGHVRADLTRDLVVALLQSVTASQPIVLIIDDVHWLDSVSLSLAEAVHRRVPNLLLAIFSRPQSPPVPLEYTALRQSPDALLLPLEQLSPSETLSLVCRRLGVESLPSQVASFIVQKAEGHPFFSEELAHAITEAGLISIANGECELASGVDLSKLSFPDTVQGVISSRIDRLSPREQLTLKIASVIGRLFQVKVLKEVHPVESDRDAIEPILQTLADHDLTLRESGAEPVYLFKHIITQEVSYALLLPSQKRELHQRVAKCLERGDSRSYAVLAHHWQHAGEVAKAVDALESAATEALAKGANREAIYFLERAMELMPEADRTRLLRWRRQLGEAHFGLGNIERSREEYGRGLALVGRAIPKSFLGMQLRASTELWRQLLRRALPKALLPKVKERQREVLVEVARIASTVGEQFFNDSNLGGLLGYGLMAINAAEATEEYEPALRSYGALAHVYGVMGLKGTANRWLNHVDAVAKRPDARASSAIARACLQLYAGQTKEALATSELATSLARGGGDRSMTVNALVVLSTVQHYMGDWSGALRSTQEVIDLGQERSNKEHEVWGLISLAIIRVHRGEHAAAVKAVDDAVAMLLQTDHNGRVCCYGSAALAHARQGQLDKAQDFAESMLEAMRQIQTPAFTLAWPLACLIETLHLLCSRDGFTKERLRQLKTAQRMLDRIALMFPFCRPRAALMLGLTHHARGQHAKAQRQWLKTIALGEQFGSVFEVALARLQLAKLVEGAERARFVRQAGDTFQRLGAAHHLREAEALLPKTPEMLRAG